MFCKFVILILINFSYCDYIFSMNYSKFLGPIRIKMNISHGDDTYEKETSFHLDLNLNYTWISKFFVKKYNFIRNSSKYEHINLTIEDLGKANALILKDNFYLKSSVKKKDVILNDFNFYLFEIKDFVGFDSIGLSHKIDNSSFSFIYQLKKQNIINKLNFAIYEKTIYGGLIFFGGIPKEIIKNKRKGTCYINRNINSWNCKLNKVCNYINNYEADFNINIDCILAPKDYINYLRYIFFDKYKNLSLCNETFDDSLYPKNKTYFICNITKFKNISPLIFDFINFKLLLNFDDLIQGDTLMIQSNEYNHNKWFIGNIFLRKIITQFDLENHSISFYGDSNSVIGNNKNIIKIIIIIQSIILYISCFFLFKLVKNILKINKQNSLL